MATFESRKDSSGRLTVRVKVRIKGYPTQSCTFSRLTDARRWAQKIEAEIREGKYFRTAEGKRRTFKDAAQRYRREIIARSPTKEKNQGFQLEWWEKQIGHRVLSDITPSVVTEYREILAKEESGKVRSAATINRYLALLSHVLSVASRDWEWLDDNPMRKVRKLKESRGRVRMLSDAERERVLANCKDSDSPWLELFVVLALSTGMRRGEISGLKWSDVDLSRKTLLIQNSKNGDRRSVGLSGKALELIKDHARLRRLDSELLFPGKDPTKPIDIRSAWETVLKRSGIEDFRFHDLRHSAASYLAMSGATLAEIAEVLGHRTLSMVKRYSHLTETHTAKVLERMNERVFG